MNKKLIFIFWVLFIAIYSINLTLLPIFEDEAEYLLLAETIKNNLLNNFFLYLQNGLFPLFGWLVAVFNFLISDSLVAGRMVNVLLASSLIWWIWAIANLYKLPKKFVLVAILLLITSPILLLNARVAMLDTAVLVFTSWYLYFALKIFENPSRKDYLGLFIALLAALLTKATVLFGIPAIIIFILIEIYKKRFHKNIFSIVLVCGLAFLISGGLFLAFSQQISRDSGSSITDHFSMANLLKRFRINSWMTFHWANTYYQPAMIALLEYFVFFKQIKYKRLYLMLGLWVVAVMAVMITLNRFYYPRHILILATPLVIFVAAILTSIPRLVSIPLFLLIMMPTIFFDWNIMFTPQKAGLAAEDRFSFYEDYTSGVGVSEIASSLDNLSKNQPIIVTVDGSYILKYGLRRELKGNKNIIFKSFQLFEGSFFTAPEVVTRDKDFKTYVVVNKWRPSNAKDLKLVRSFPVSSRHVRFLYVIQ